MNQWEGHHRQQLKNSTLYCEIYLFIWDLFVGEQPNLHFVNFFVKGLMVTDVFCIKVPLRVSKIGQIKTLTWKVCVFHKVNTIHPETLLRPKFQGLSLKTWKHQAQGGAGGKVDRKSVV